MNAQPSDANKSGSTATERSERFRVLLRSVGSWLRSARYLVLAVVAYGGLLWLTWGAGDDFLREHRDRDALFVLGLFMLIGLASIGAIGAIYPKMNVTAPLLALVLLVPLVSYLALTGRLTSLSLPGGGSVELSVSASLTEHRTVLEPVSVPVVEVFGTPTPAVLECQGTEPAEPAEYTVPQQAEPIVPDPTPPEQQDEATRIPTAIATSEVPVRLGPTVFWRLTLEICDYDFTDLKDKLDADVETGAFRFILLVWQDNQFFAYIPARDAVLLFEKDARALVESINGNPYALMDDKKFDGIEFDTLRISDSTHTALDTMANQNLDMLPVRDDEHYFLGVITWHQTMTSMMMELAQQLATHTVE